MTRFATLRGGLVGAAVFFVAGCASAPAPSASTAPVAQAPDAPAPVPEAVHWTRTAAEQRMVYREVYAMAGSWLARTVAGGVDGAWGVILDADETVLDNSLYQLRRARQGLGYSSESWNEWVREEAAPPLPGAVDFIAGVKALGGHVAIVTNRDEAVCDATRRNLAAVGVDADVVLCREPGVSEKETRFQAVQDGTTPAGLPPLTVLAWAGDNIRDFPGGTQALRQAPEEALADFGAGYFVLPNPMYGSWTSNPVR